MATKLAWAMREERHMDTGITGKRALVTGGARGIGRATALRLAEEGCHVAVADVDEAALASSPADVLSVVCDVSSEEQVEGLVETVRRELGGVDIFVSNAGVFGSARLADTSLADWERMMRVNLSSAFALCRLLLAPMKEQGWGRIITVASLAGQMGGLTASAAYAASKAGLMSLTKSVAREGAPNVTANAVAPAYIDTDMVPPDVGAAGVDMMPVGRLGTADEVAAAVVFLASAHAGFITGAVLNINGGLLMG